MSDQADFSVNAVRPVRSALYVPGTRPELFAKAVASGADQVILDLEDAVPPDLKDAARDQVSDLVSQAISGPPVWVRVNAGALGTQDVAAVSGPGLAGICLAKAESAEDIRHVVDAAGSAAGRPVPVEPLVESALAVSRLETLAAAAGVVRLQLGETDLSGDVGVADDALDEGLAYARSRIVFASAAAGLLPPMAPVSPGFRDLATLTTSTQRLARLGFVGRVCIHPAQVPVVNDIFTPDSASLQRARALVAAVDEQARQGCGAFVGTDGHMVDAAHVRAAHRLIALSEHFERSNA